MTGHVPLRELHGKLFDARERVFTDRGMTGIRKCLLAIMVLSYVATTIASFALPVKFRWTSLITLGVETVAGILFYRDIHKSESLDRQWLDEYDLLAAEDGRTIQWISTFKKSSIVRSLETLKERTIGEDVAFSLVFGPVGNLGFIAILGIIYTQADTALSSHLSTPVIILRVFIATLIAVTYAASWRQNVQRVRRDRMKLILEFALSRLEANGLVSASLPGDSVTTADIPVNRAP